MELGMKAPRYRFSKAQLHALIAVTATVAAGVFANVLAGRHFRRWDWTENRRYTLSSATRQTLAGLEDTLSVWVLLGPADPLEQSVKQLLVAYEAETRKLEIHYIDPERDVLALEDVKRRFKIETERNEQGHLAADAVIVIARGPTHWFVTSQELLEVNASDDTKVQPREERALTAAIRHVLGGKKTKACFTNGHGEASLTDPSDHGAGALRDVLDKNNFETASIDLAAPSNATPLDGCDVAVIAGVRAPFSSNEIERLRTWLLGGGNLLLGIGPIFGTDAAAPLVPAGFERVLEPFGVALADDVIAERDPAFVFPEELGVRFVAQPKPHEIANALLKAPGTRDAPRMIVHRARSLRKLDDKTTATATAVLTTSPEALGMVSIDGAARWSRPPEAHVGDHHGPLPIAFASSLPKTNAGTLHGPRLVVVGTESPLLSASFREAVAYRGAALFTESALAWLTEKPPILDVPERAPVGAGIRIDEESRGTIRRYVVLFMPASVALLGLAIALVRRSGDGAARKPRRPKTPA
jgi:hypothetical protein